MNYEIPAIKKTIRYVFDLNQRKVKIAHFYTAAIAAFP